MLHQQSHAVSGAIVFLVLAVSAVTQLTLARYPSRSVVLGGLGLLPVGLAAIVGALAGASVALFLLGTVIGGVALGALYMGSLTTANRLAPAEQRGKTLSTFLVFGQVGLTVPVIGVGIASEYVGDLRAVFGCAIVLALLCAISLVGIREAAGKSRASHSRDRRGVA